MYYYSGLKDIAVVLYRPASLTMVRYSLKQCSSLSLSVRTSSH